MPTSTAQVTTEQITGSKTTAITKPADIVYEPRYIIDSTFSAITMDWVLNAANTTNKPFKIEFSASRNSQPHSDTFKDVGFSNPLFNDDVSSSLPLFTAQIPNLPTISGQPNLVASVSDGNSNGDSTVTITIEASDVAVFSISPHQSW